MGLGALDSVAYGMRLDTLSGPATQRAKPIKEPIGRVTGIHKVIVTCARADCKQEIVQEKKKGPKEISGDCNPRASCLFKTFGVGIRESDAYLLKPPTGPKGIRACGLRRSLIGTGMTGSVFLTPARKESSSPS